MDISKKTWVVTSVVLSILTLIYTILVYYGYHRSFELRRKPCSVYLSNYHTLERADTCRVVVSFTTTPERIPYLKPFLNSILDQSVKVDDIALSIPYKYRQYIPEELKQIVRIYPFSVEYKDVASLIPTLLREGENDTKIILVKDNTIYGPDFIEEMVKASNANPDKIIYGNSNKNIESGILIKPAFFDTRVTNYNDGQETCNSWLEKCSNQTSINIDYKDNFVL